MEIKYLVWSNIAARDSEDNLIFHYPYASIFIGTREDYTTGQSMEINECTESGTHLEHHRSKTLICKKIKILTPWEIKIEVSYLHNNTFKDCILTAEF